VATKKYRTIHPEVSLEDFSVRIKRAQLFIVVILAVALATIVYLVFITRSRNERFERFRRAYAEIKVGDSRNAVLVAMGEPHEVTDCPYTPFSDPKREAEFRSKCFQQYRYGLFMREYTISFDRNGTVINKSTAVSP
jgi:hypothetical protein